jgi:hypothetical protein
MTRRFHVVTYVLVGMLALAGAVPAQSANRIASQTDLDAAIAKSVGRDDAARHTISTLLQRDEVRRLAKAQGLDLRRAEAAVGTLQGDELQRLSVLAANADVQLAGGDEVIRISLVTLLLVIIIIILVAR